MNKLKEIDKNNYNNKTFEDIKHISEHGNEYWEARELQIALNYSKWENFTKVVEKAKVACSNSNNNISEHFPEVRKPIIGGNGNIQYVVDYCLSRYACYLIVQNGDPRKEVIALGQTYFAVQTRKQELTEREYEMLSDTEKRFYQRKLTKQGNYTLQQTAAKAGVKNMAQFHNAGYKGLYNGETADDIFKRKKLRYREDILDNMNEDELVANLFRINQTKQKLVNDNIEGEENAKDVHFEVGKKVRETIKELGGTMPEDFTNAKKEFKGIKERRKKEINYCR